MTERSKEELEALADANTDPRRTILKRVEDATWQEVRMRDLVTGDVFKIKSLDYDHANGQTYIAMDEPCITDKKDGTAVWSIMTDIYHEPEAAAEGTSIPEQNPTE